MNTVFEFQDEFRFLSNFWPASVVLDGVTYPTVEHAYQAAKTQDPQEREIIRVQRTPGDAKRAGRRKNITVRSDWNKVRVDIMRELCAQKFSHEPLRQMLLDTGGAELIEGNFWGDEFWGICRGVGQNMLGKILMDIREAMKQ